MILLFEKASISATSVAAASTGVNLDFWMVPAANLLTVSAIQGQIILYFRDGNPYSETLSTGEALTGSFRFATITFNVTTGKESEVAENFYKFILAGPKAIVPIPSVRQIFKFSNVTSEYADIPDIVNIDNIRRYTTYDAITGTGSGGLPIGGDLDQVLTKLSSVDGDVDWVYPHTLYIRVRNTSGGTLPKGTPVHATGVTGTVPDVIAADAAIPSAMPATYVLNESIADNAQGVAIIVGTITGVNTSAFSAGDVVFVAAGGGFTNVKPTGTNLIQNLGVVTRSNVTTGSGVVYGAGRSNDVPNLPTGKFFIGSATNTVESAYTLPTADGTSNQVLTTNGAGAVTFQSANPLVVYSDANKIDHTGSTSNTLMTSFLLPANSLDVGDLFYLLARTNRSAPQSANANIRYYVNTANSLSGATLIGTGPQMGSTARYGAFERTYAILNQTTNTNAFGATSLILTDIATTTILPSTLAVDWTADQYIIIAGQLANIADTISVIYFFAEITKQKV